MKKLILFTLVLTMLFSAIPVLANSEVTVELDGKVIECTDANGNPVSPLLINGTTYLPVRAIANALGLDVQWDGATQSVFINGVSVLAKKTGNINIFINGAAFTAKDVNGNVVYPILQNGTTYLPVRAIADAFDKDVEWIDATKTVKLTTKQAPVVEVTVIDKTKTYAFVNTVTGKALTATDHYTLVSEDFTEKASQGFRFAFAPVDGFYFISSVSNGQNLDVSGHSTVPGGEIITWDATGAENQMFTIKDVEGGIYIVSYTSGLALQPSTENTVQNTLGVTDSQIWKLVEIKVDAPVVNNTGAYRTFTIAGSVLTDNNGLGVTSANSSDNQKWKLVEVSDGQYVITNLATDMSLDVSGQSLNAGDPIITWYTNSDVNQRWVLEKQADGTYLIKSVHSGLYLTIASNNTLIQTHKDSNQKQSWTMDFTN